jgi:hypothetical protein
VAAVVAHGGPRYQPTPWAAQLALIRIPTLSGEQEGGVEIEGAPGELYADNFD